MVILQRSPCAGFAANELSVIEASATGSAGFLGPGFTAGYEAGAAAVRMFSVRRRPADPAETLCASQKSAGFRKSVTQLDLLEKEKKRKKPDTKEERKY